MATASGCWSTMPASMARPKIHGPTIRGSCHRTPSSVAEPAFQMVSHRAGAHHHHVAGGRDTFGDRPAECLEVLQATRLTRRGVPTTAVPRGVVTDMTDRPMAARNVRPHPLDARCVIDDTNDDGLARVDPDELGRHSLLRRGRRG